MYATLSYKLKTITHRDKLKTLPMVGKNKRPQTKMYWEEQSQLKK